MNDRFISVAEVLDRIGFSRTHLYRKINAGTFPKPVPLGPKKVGFLESEVANWMEERLVAREQKEGVEARRKQALLSVEQAAQNRNARASKLEVPSDV